MTTTYTTQNDLLLHNLTEFYKKDDNLNKMLQLFLENPRYSNCGLVCNKLRKEALHGLYDKVDRESADSSHTTTIN